MRNGKGFWIVGFLALVLVGCGQTPTSVTKSRSDLLSAQSSDSTSVQTWPINGEAYVACAAGGTGEYVAFTGDARVVSRTTVSASGNISTAFHLNYQGVSGVGLDTGDKYQATSGFQGGSFSGAASGSSFTSSVRLIGQGAGNNLFIRSVFRIVVNANGDMSVVLQESKLECQ